MSLKNRSVLWSLAALVGLVAVWAAAMGWLFFSSVVPGAPDEVHELKIRRGMGYNQIVARLVEQGIIESRKKVDWVAQLLGYKGRIKAGRYRIPGGASSYALLKQLVEGRIALERVTIPEGSQAREIAGLLQRKIEIDSARFMHLVQDTAYVRRFGLDAPSLEGFLFPDTYRFHWGMSEEQVIERLVGEFKKRFDDTLQARAKALGWRTVEVVALASIIEGESMLDSERPIISGVYHNRLRHGMRLQADPTIQYIIPDGPRRLLKRDLEIDSPYNTYLYRGLPPGPVNNPGIESIRASLYPADVDYIYFVANGDGSHTFSRTWREHLKAKARFDAYRERVKRMQQGERRNGEKAGQG